MDRDTEEDGSIEKKDIDEDNSEEGLSYNVNPNSADADNVKEKTKGNKDNDNTEANIEGKGDNEISKISEGNNETDKAEVDEIINEGDNGTDAADDGKLGIRDYKLFGIIVGIIIIVLVAIFAFNHFYKPGQKTINEEHADVLAGKEDDSHYMYNGYSFVRQGSDNIGYMWYTQVMNPYDMIKYDVPLHYGPKQLEEIPFEGNIDYFMKMMYGKNNTLPDYDEFNVNTTLLPYTAYFSFDPTIVGLDYINLAHHELRTNLLQVFDVRLLPACTTEDSACDSIAILTCQNTTVPIIVFQEAENSSIIAKGNCITVAGVNTGIVKSVDKLMYRMYGIME